MSTKVNELTPKVDRYTVTDPDGQLSATEYNVILDAVQRHETQLDDNDFLRFSEQALDDSDKRQARQNIGVVGEDDYAPKMSVGFADNLVGRGEATPEEFVFQPTANDVSVQDGTARIAKIKGNSVVWNQQCYERSTDLSRSSGVEGVKRGFLPVPNYKVNPTHKYILISELNNKVNYIDNNHTRIFLYDTINRSEITTVFRPTDSISKDLFTVGKHTSAKIFTGIAGTLSFIYCDINQGEDVTDYSSFSSIFVDLTKMFGAGNEPTTIEDFYARIPSGIDIHAYNEGEIISMNTEAIKTVGFNAWDEQWENGQISALNGQNINNDSLNVRTKNYIPVIPNQDYFCTLFDKYIFCYDKDKKYIGVLKSGESTTGWVGAHIFWENEFPNGTAYIRMFASTSYGKNYNHDICINLSNTGRRNGEYEPYETFTRELGVIKKYFPEGMCKAGSVADSIEWDSSRQKWVAVQRVGEVDLGDLNWLMDSAYYINYAEMGAAVPNQANRPNFITIAPMKATSSNNASGNKNSSEVYVDPHSKNLRWYADTSLYPNVASLKAAMQGVKLYYELAEPIVTEIEGLPELDYLVWDFGTEEALSSVPSAPFSADIIYQFNAVDRIRENTLRVQQLEAMLSQMQAAFASMQAQEASTLIE